MTIKEFSKAYADKKWSKIPSYGRPEKQFKDNSANELTKSMLAWFEFNGIYAYRQSSEGRFIQPKKVKNVLGREITLGKGTWIPRSKGGKGLGDVSAIINGLFTSWEVKHGKDKQSDVQKETQAKIEASGGRYFIVKNWDDFMFQVEKVKSKTLPLTERSV